MMGEEEKGDRERVVDNHLETVCAAGQCGLHRLVLLTARIQLGLQPFLHLARLGELPVKLNLCRTVAGSAHTRAARTAQPASLMGNDNDEDDTARGRVAAAGKCDCSLGQPLVGLVRSLSPPAKKYIG